MDQMYVWIEVLSHIPDQLADPRLSSHACEQARYLVSLRNV